MGTYKLATWLALFALVANASYGLGLEQARPGAMANTDSVCAAQSVIATLSTPEKDADSNVCQLQMVLDGACDNEDFGSDDNSPLLYGTTLQTQTPQIDPGALALPFVMNQIACALDAIGAISPATAFISPPGSLPVEQCHRTLRSPNAPPRIA